MIPQFELRLFHWTILICQWRRNMLDRSKYQPRLWIITNVAPDGSANQIAVFTSNQIILVYLKTNFVYW